MSDSTAAWVEKARSIYDKYEFKAVIETLYTVNLINSDEYDVLLKGVN